MELGEVSKVDRPSVFGNAGPIPLGWDFCEENP